MIILDTSAWVECLRATGSEVDAAVTSLLADGGVVVPDVVRLELLAGAGTEEKALELSRLLARYPALPTSSPADHELAAALLRAGRAAGETVRSLLDCMIAAMALRVGACVLARDRDFGVLTGISALELYDPRS